MEDEPFIDVDLTKVSSEIVNVPTQNIFMDQLVDTMSYFFGKGDHSFSADYPGRKTPQISHSRASFFTARRFRKNEFVKQAAKKLWNRLELDFGLNIRLMHVNSANIFTKELGALEKRMKRVFTKARVQTKRTIAQ